MIRRPPRSTLDRSSAASDVYKGQFWNNANLLMYPEGFLKSPSTVRVLAPDVWKVATGLPGVPGQKNTFRAENFDILYDSPFEASNFKTLVFNVKGVPHRIVIDGAGNYDPERMRRDVQKIVETEVELMGGEIPYRDYTFILHLRQISYTHLRAHETPEHLVCRLLL